MPNVLKNFLDGFLLLGSAGERRNYIPLSVSPAKVAKQNLSHSWSTVSKGIAKTARRKLSEAKETRN